ncbi:hypothetical protein F4780DRAFT_779355 [Xylariomycetidae sp. FL0641]|nr:hypothetical protein F4780DRAFT_779355 [Xylariomycetidae sp. FL0641]
MQEDMVSLSGDVEMEGTEPAGGGAGIGNGSGSVSGGNGSGKSNGLDAAPEAPNPANGAPHTTLSFGVKSDGDEETQPQQQSQPPSSSPVDSVTKMKAAPKKKGTASTKKGPKKAKTPKSKAAPKKAGGAAAGDANDASSGDETDNGPYCICRGPDDHRWMIGCDVCEDWFHGECVKLDKEVGEKLVERFVCPNCTDGKRNYTKYKKTCSHAGCKNPARLYTKNPKDRSVFCSNDHCDAWWSSMIATLPREAASRKAIEVLTQEDFMGLLAATADKGGWKLGDKPFGNIEGLWSKANGLPTRAGVLSEEEESFLLASAAERLALGNEIVQYKKMLQLLDWANERRQAGVDAGRWPKDVCGYDRRLDTVSVRVQFAAWLDSPEGQAVFKAGRLEEDAESLLVCDRKRCKPHNAWYKLLSTAVRLLIKETATAAASKLDAEDGMRRAAEARYERRQLENNFVEVL